MADAFVALHVHARASLYVCVQSYGQLLEMIGSDLGEALSQINKLHAHLLKVAHFPTVRHSSPPAMSASLSSSSSVNFTELSSHGLRGWQISDHVAHLQGDPQKREQHAPTLHTGQRVAARPLATRRRYTPHLTTHHRTRHTQLCLIVQRNQVW